MTYEDKLKLVIEELLEGRKASIDGNSAKIYSKSTLVSKIPLPEIKDILKGLEAREKVLTVWATPTALDAGAVFIPAVIKEYFGVAFNDNFDAWYAKFLISQKSKLGNLSRSNFTGVYSLLHQINQNFELASSEKLVLQFIENHYQIDGMEHADLVELQEDY